MKNSKETMKESVDLHDLNFFEISLFVLFVELAEKFIFVSHFFRDFGEEMEDKVFERFLWPVDDEFLVSGGEGFGELGVLCFVH